MSREENPNPRLTKMSVDWGGYFNPVRGTLTLWRIYKFTAVIIALLIGHCIVTYALNMPWVISKTDVSLWGFVGITLSVTLCGLIIDILKSPNFRDGRLFIDAISILEKVVGKPSNQLGEADHLEEKARAYLANLASAVDSYEALEKDKRGLKPWETPEVARTVIRRRKEFNLHFSILTRALPEIPQSKGEYYPDKATIKNTEEVVRAMLED
ncbi:MAG: hypothetical protein WCO48_00855 [Candidatus Taylorbacteria bacterium]